MTFLYIGIVASPRLYRRAPHPYLQIDIFVFPSWVTPTRAGIRQEQQTNTVEHPPVY